MDRLTDAERAALVAKNTIAKLLAELGSASERFHGETVRDVRAKRFRCDEIWSFVFAKARSGRAEPKRGSRLPVR